jgi:hypothetical protein
LKPGFSGRPISNPAIFIKGAFMSIISIPLSKLVPSPLNVRKTGGKSLDDLVILAGVVVDLASPLVVQSLARSVDGGLDGGDQLDLAAVPATLALPRPGDVSRSGHGALRLAPSVHLQLAPVDGHRKPYPEKQVS